ncbi:MAG: PAS domain-containing protein [Rubrivivax sp.]|nr:PAS domain-containing protein [Rubrivivax sp.]
MSTTAREAEENLSLRQRALAHLTGSTTQPAGRASPSQALAVLHALASSPETAPDALALLHELQVHQVELELQQEELRRSRDDLEAELSRRTALVDHAPVPYLTLDTTTRVVELNHAAAQLLGATRDELRGKLLTPFLAARSGRDLYTLLARVQGGGAPQRCELQLAAGPAQAPALLALASADPAGKGCLLALVALGPGPDDDAGTR